MLSPVRQIKRTLPPAKATWSQTAKAKPHTLVMQKEEVVVGMPNRLVKVQIQIQMLVQVQVQVQVQVLALALARSLGMLSVLREQLRKRQLRRCLFKTQPLLPLNQ